MKSNRKRRYPVATSRELYNVANRWLEMQRLLKQAAEAQGLPCKKSEDHDGMVQTRNEALRVLQSRLVKQRNNLRSWCR